MADRAPSPRRWRNDLGWWWRGVRRRLGADAPEREALAAYAGLVHQAFHAAPFAPAVCADLWWRGRFQSGADLPPFFSPGRRERENSSHHYGHDVLLKRHAGLPLVGTPLPLLLEHGLKVSDRSSFETPRPWSKAFLCMGPLRARWVRERFAIPAIPIGPWIAYARPLLAPPRLERLRDELGPVLLVVLAHSWDAVERRMDIAACVRAVENLRRREGYRSVILLRHWKDPAWAIPADWIVACNGHRSNPWFLDSLVTLLSLATGLVSNAFGTHLGYALHRGLRLHWLAVAAEQDLSALAGTRAEVEAIEWRERLRLGGCLADLLAGGWSSASAGAVRALLDPYWGFGCVRGPQELLGILRDPSRER